MRFEEIIEEAIVKCGNATALASELAVCDQEITRMRKPGAKITMKNINEILKISKLTITRGDERENLINAALTFADLYKMKNK